MNVAQVCREYLAEQRRMRRDGDPAALSPRTIADYEEALERHIIPAFGTMRCSAFRPTHAAQYLLRCRRDGRGVRGNREIAALASAMNHALALGIVDANPCRGVRRNKERPRTRAVSIGELNALLELAERRGGASHMVALIATMTALTGRRRAEIRALRRDQIGEEGVCISDSKNRAGRRYLVRWSPLLRRVVETASRLRYSPEVAFPTRSGAPYTDAGFKALWSRLMREYEAQTGERFRAHDLRALYVSEMLDRGADPHTHANSATMKRVYDRRRTIEVEPLA